MVLGQFVALRRIAVTCTIPSARYNQVSKTLHVLAY